MKSAELIKFLNIIEKLKCVTRHSFTSSGRQESVAEHCWRCAVMAMLCADEYPEIDINRVIKMCLIHDFGEAITGDIPAFEKTSDHEKAEANAIDSLLSIASDVSLTELFKEISEMKTDEAKLFNSIDKLEAVISHNEADLSTWTSLEYELNLTYAKKDCEWSDTMAKLRDIVKEQTVRKINSSKKVLVTGGTVFVSRFIAEYYVKSGYEVYVLNRNSKPQSDGVILIEADRHNLGDKLKNYCFDVVIDATGYDEKDVIDLLDALGEYKDYIFISSSAVYPEFEKQPFSEKTPIGENKYWGAYGTNKIAAEKALLSRVPNAYIIRPPYLYGPMNNLYRESFVFDCAIQNRKFCLPKDGNMKLQFFHIEDLCRFIDKILEIKPNDHIFNVGNRDLLTVKEWVELCYQVVGKTAEFFVVAEDIEQRNYFSFYDYQYCLDVSKQTKLFVDTKPLKDGLAESYEWYIKNGEDVNKKPYLEFIDKNIFGERNEQ